jgi:hypothetical protein
MQIPIDNLAYLLGSDTNIIELISIDYIKTLPGIKSCPTINCSNKCNVSQKFDCTSCLQSIY